MILWIQLVHIIMYLISNFILIWFFFVTLVIESVDLVNLFKQPIFCLFFVLF